MSLSLMALFVARWQVVVVIPKLMSTDGLLWFGVRWTWVALGLTVFYAVNAFSEKGIASDEIPPHEAFPTSVEHRLETLSRLRNQDVITENEYPQRRRAMLEEI